MSVLVMPGAIQFILILNFPNSEDITFESDSTAALLDEYADLPSLSQKLQLMKYLQLNLSYL